jgi:NAD+ synthase
MDRQFDAADAAKKLTDFIRRFVSDTGFSKIVMGISGGVDSSVSAALGARAVGPENMLVLIMPYRSSLADSESDAVEIVRLLGVEYEKIDISPMIDVYYGNRDVSKIRRGNKLARERMSILFDIASRDTRLVQGTSNKTEICLGYSTWYGDSACSFNPLGGLYKREIREMARHLGIPEKIIDKNPTADLWPGQTDEGELGIRYDTADRVLFEIVENGERSLAKIVSAAGADEKVVREIVGRINRFLYKRSLPVTDLMGRKPVPDRVTLTEK